MGEFFLTLEKDPQQEDFLQGRMQGNPYRFVLTRLPIHEQDYKSEIYSVKMRSSKGLDTPVVVKLTIGIVKGPLMAELSLFVLSVAMSLAWVH